MGVWGYQENKERGDCQVSRDLLEYLAPRDQWVQRAFVGPLACLVLKENKVHRDQ